MWWLGNRTEKERSTRECRRGKCKVVGFELEETRRDDERGKHWEDTVWKSKGRGESQGCIADPVTAVVVVGDHSQVGPAATVALLAEQRLTGQRRCRQCSSSCRDSRSSTCARPLTPRDGFNTGGYSLVCLWRNPHLPEQRTEERKVAPLPDSATCRARKHGTKPERRKHS
ncbi:hypothetical protein KFL_000770040 [Klebsormidium nitens]|uniref:Uncharacterized protein n=1 Tax=Klebsormidium nitens TaxID=105231 RepID=A0A1Y1HRQ2_KLENI|nr:hypothetical protein KFL_000770040 [Klebsormidium nitens]|eukprot:GAQ81310.1 hypothetical protein KFL_000770040 [Klebsormidium nitens]